MIKVISMANLIKCTFKKSISVTKKVGMASIILGSVFGYISLWICNLMQIWDQLMSVIDIYSKMIFSQLYNCIEFLTSIPWFVWIIIAIPCSIIGYSGLWCYDKQHNGIISNKITITLIVRVIITAIILYVIGLILFSELSQFQLSMAVVGLIISITCLAGLFIDWDWDE